MTSERWRQIEELYHSARESGRDVLASAAADLRVDVESLLAEDSGDSILDRPALELFETPPPTRLEAGTLLGPYRIESQLGVGGMGAVYRATDTRLGRVVAIKIPAAHYSERFQSEARFISTLNHPHICSLYDVGPDYLVMEFIEGSTLATEIRKRALVPELVARYGAQIAAALAEAHSRDIVHCDLKPTNIMVTRHGVKVLDFGVAKMLSESGGTEATGLLGTPAYMPPEEIRGQEPNSQTDLFALGLVLYEMAAGRLPFPGRSLGEMLLSSSQTTVVAPFKARTGLPAKLNTLVTKLLEKDPARRPESAYEVAQMLSRLAAETQTRGGVLSRPIYFVPAVAFLLPLLLLIGLLAYRAVREPGSPVQYAAKPLTSYVGEQLCPTFAPDGERVAFSWNGPQQDNFDIYEKQVGVTVPVRLTNGPEPDISPAWSPDGRTIAYIHLVSRELAEVLLMPAHGSGPIRKLTNVPAVPEFSFHLRFVAWSPDGRWIAVTDGQKGHPNGMLFLVSVETGERRVVTSPPVGYDDASAVFSPDMKALCFVRYSGAFTGDLYYLRLSKDLRPLGGPERLTSFNRLATSPVWTRDGKAILFVRHEAGGSPGLWRIEMGRKRRIEALPIPAENSYGMALSLSGTRVVYTHDSENINIWSVDLKQGNRPSRARSFIASTWVEANPQFSPDGQKIAYQSSRSGSMEIWICDRDASNPRQLTHLNAVISGFPHWSPDGKKIVFHARTKSLARLYVVSVEGGEPQEITRDSGSSVGPSWSHDGRSIYFSGQRSGIYGVWRVPANGGKATRMGERWGGNSPLESKDGRFLYYLSSARGALRAIPLSGGAETELFDGVKEASYAPATDGIYFIRSMAGGSRHELAFFRFASHSVNIVAEIPRPPSLRLALSPDEDTLLYGQLDRRSSDLMLVDNFH